MLVYEKKFFKQTAFCLFGVFIMSRVPIVPGRRRLFLRSGEFSAPYWSGADMSYLVNN